MTSDRDEANIAQTAEYFVIPASFPCSVALFSCSCGAKTLEYEVERVAPTGWVTTEDGELRCPVCAERDSGRTPDELPG